MLKLAVIGKDVSKSDSPAIHEFILRRRFHTQCTYERVSIPPDLFAARAEELFARYDGFNVTIPFKTDILPFLRKTAGDAKVFGAVNTVLCASRTGYNTDGFGFLLMLENEGVEVKGKSVLVLGAGGAGRSCVAKLAEAGAEVFVYERDAARLAAVHGELGGFTPLSRVPERRFDVLLNCTGVGMHTTEGMLPSLTYESGEEDTAERLLRECGQAADLIYVPARSRFLQVAEQYGKPAVNGASMLFYQAYMADCLYLSVPADAEEAGRLWKEYKERTL